MIALIGLAVVVASVIGGFSIAGGHVPALFHVSELVVVGGTALGTVLISTPMSVIKGLLLNVPLIIRPSPFSKTLYLEALKMLFELYQIAQRDGLVAIESHIEDPHNSELLKKYPKVLRHRHVVTFLCDSLRLVLLGSVPPYDLDTLMDNEIEVHHETEAKMVQTLNKVGDSLPGIGIVAAVLGVVVTMGAIDGPIEEIGKHVAAALTGTFLGVLLAYGFVSPLASALEHMKADETRFFHFIKASVVLTSKGSNPLVASEFARRAIGAETRPSFAEMEAVFKSLKAKPATKGQRHAKAA